jgi:hypothetical protein
MQFAACWVQSPTAPLPGIQNRGWIRRHIDARRKRHPKNLCRRVAGVFFTPSPVSEQSSTERPLWVEAV